MRKRRVSRCRPMMETDKLFWSWRASRAVGLTLCVPSGGGCAAAMTSTAASKGGRVGSWGGGENRETLVALDRGEGKGWLVEEGEAEEQQQQQHSRRRETGGGSMGARCPLHFLTWDRTTTAAHSLPR